MNQKFQLQDCSIALDTMDTAEEATGVLTSPQNYTFIIAAVCLRFGEVGSQRNWGAACILSKLAEERDVIFGIDNSLRNIFTTVVVEES